MASLLITSLEGMLSVCYFITKVIVDQILGTRTGWGAIPSSCMLD